MSEPKKKVFFKYFNILFSIIIFFAVFKVVTEDKSFDFYRILKLNLFILILATGVTQLFINCLNQKVLLNIYRIKISLYDLFLHNSISSLFVLIIPGYFAPDFYLSIHYGKEKKDYGRVISALLISRTIGFFSFFVFALFAFLYLGLDIINLISINISAEQLPIYYIAFISFAVFISLILFLRKKILGYLSRLPKFIKFKNILNETKGHGKEYYISFVLRFVFMLTGVIGRAAIGYSLGLNLPILKFISIIIIVNLLISLPVSFNGVGVREAGYIGLLSQFDVPGDTAFLFSIAEFGITLLGAFLGLMSYLLYKLQIKLSHNGRN